jgi:hypothetical protein
VLGNVGAGCRCHQEEAGKVFAGLVKLAKTVL